MNKGFYSLNQGSNQTLRNSLKGPFDLNQNIQNEKENNFYDALKTLVNWNSTFKGNSKCTVLNARRGKQKITTGTSPGDYFMLEELNNPVTLVEQPIFRIKFKMAEIVNTRLCFGLYSNPANYIQFNYEASGQPENWQVETRSKGKSTVNETFLEGNTDPHIFEIECQLDKVIFKFDGSSQVIHNTDLTSSSLKCFYKQESLSQDSRESTIFFISLSYD